MCFVHAWTNLYYMNVILFTAFYDCVVKPKAEAMNEETNCKKFDMQSVTENNPKMSSLRISVTETARGPRLMKQRSEKTSCLCSPTKHIGSFRCRMHRNICYFGSGSYGSGHSDLADKDTGVSESNGAWSISSAHQWLPERGHNSQSIYHSHVEFCCIIIIFFLTSFFVINHALFFFSTNDSKSKKKRWRFHHYVSTLDYKS